MGLKICVLQPDYSTTKVDYQHYDPARNLAALIPDAITRSVFVKDCSRILDIEEQTLLNELNKFRKTNYNKKQNITVNSRHKIY